MTGTGLGMPEGRAAELIAEVSDVRDPALAEDVFARAAWTAIAEPGDGVAGALAARFGPARLLRAVTEKWPVESLLESVGGVDTTATPEMRDVIAAAIERWHPRISPGRTDALIRRAGRLGARLLTPHDDLWPTGVDDLGDHAPFALWVRGQVGALAALDRSVAIVGARAATGYGEHVTADASAGLVDRGYAIVSGAAYGIDGMAHRAALATEGTTVAFLAGGPDRFYPSGHDDLLHRICRTGAVITELPVGEPPTRWRFLQRNRLIAAASQATVVVEAGRRSGSLNTAGHAAALGRPLGAVPGPVTSASSEGCHRLIREFDAVCVTNADQMAELAGPLGDGSTGVPLDLFPADPRRTRLLDALSARDARTTAQLAARSGMASGEVQELLGVLAIEGLVAPKNGAWRKVS